VICMEDFSPQSKVSWLPCDRRHFFHKSCIMFWLVKQSQCPLCKCEVDFEKAQRMKIQANQEADDADHQLLLDSKRTIEI